MAPNLK